MAECRLKTFWVVAVLLMVMPAVTVQAEEEVQGNDGLVLGLAPGLYFENSGLHGERRVVVNEPMEESFDYSSSAVLSLQAYLLAPLGSHTRLGGGLRYAGEYTAEYGEDDEEQYSFGHLFDVFAQFEYIIDSLPVIDLIVGARLGLFVLFPGGDFQRDIDDLQDQGAGVWSVPRLGGFLSPMLSVRWPLHENFALRGGFAFTAGRLFLFNDEEEIQVNNGSEVQTFPFAIDRYTNILRYEFTAGAEVTF